MTQVIMQESPTSKMTRATKIALIAGLRERLENDIKSFRDAAATVRQMVADAPGRNDSRYDTLKIESGWLASSQMAMLAQRQQELCALVCFQPTAESSERVMLGSLVTAMGPMGKLYHFLVAPAGAGMELEWEDEIVTVVSIASPVTRAMLGHGPGESALVNNRVPYTISDVA